MKKFILLLCICWCICCKDKKIKNTTTISEKTSIGQTNTNQNLEIRERLTTENCIPFFHEYAKKNPEKKVRIITSLGNIDIELYEQTPYHRANFIFLVKEGYFDDTCFHRVVKNFIIQGGNSDSWDTSRKRRDIGHYLLPPDTKKGFRHHRGTLSMPSSEIDNPHQFASPYEFFIVCQHPGAYHLDKDYTAFGKVVSGMDIVDTINNYPVDEREWPIKNVKMKMVILN